MFVKNVEELLNHGDRELRRDLLNAIEVALRHVDPYELTKRLVELVDGQLRVGNRKFDMNQLGRIRVIGAGKATYPIAQALEDILGNHISDGLIIVKEDEARTLSRIKVVRSGHPLPSESGFEAAQEIVKMSSSSRKEDLFLVAFTGGCSALMPCPVESVSLEDKREVTRLLLGSGATIREINSVRKHLSRTKGGCLAKTISPATIINITVSDVIGDPLDCITDPTVTDSSTFGEAINALKKHDLWTKAPSSVRNRLANGTSDRETLKEYGDLRVHSFIIANNVMAADAARDYLKTSGYDSQVLTTSLEGESREVGYVLASIASEIIQFDRPLKKPAAFVCAGETLVRVEEAMEQNGLGGPSQELAVAVALRLPANHRVAGIFLDTDGSDGPTNLAGAIIGSETTRRAEALHLDLYDNLKKHNVSLPLEKLSDTIVTGPTGTNVMDLAVVVVSQ